MLRYATHNNFSERGRERYYQLKPKLAGQYDPGDVVLIEPESGDYFVAKTTMEAYQKATVQHPDKEFFMAQVGRLASFLK